VRERRAALLFPQDPRNAYDHSKVAGEPIAPEFAKRRMEVAVVAPDVSRRLVPGTGLVIGLHRPASSAFPFVIIRANVPYR